MNLLGRSLNQPVEVDPQSSEWPERALNRVLSVYPELVGCTSVIKMEEENEGAQSGQGTITFRQGEQFMEVPFWIHEGKLQPIDIMVMDGEAMPLSHGRLRRLFLNSGDLGQLSMESDGDPHYGNVPVRRIGNASTGPGPYGVKTASDLLSVIAQTAVPARLKQKLAAQPAAVYQAIQAAGPWVSHQLTKVGHLVDYPPPPPQPASEAFYVETRAPGQYKVAFVGGGQQGALVPTEVFALGGAQARAFMEKVGWPHGLDYVDRYGVGCFPVATSPVAVTFDEHFTDDLALSPKLAAGPALVWDQQGQAHDGLVLHHHDYQGQATGQQLFLAPTGYTVQPTLAGQAKQAGTPDDLSPRLLEALGQQVWDTGFAQKIAFCWAAPDGYHITTPVMLVSTIQEGDTTKFACQHPMGGAVLYRASASLAFPVNQGGTQKTASPQPQTVLIPASFTPLALNMDELIPAPAHQVKIGFATRRQQQATPPLTLSGDQGRYVVAHPGMAKQATTDGANLPLWLAAFGLDPMAQQAVQAKLAQTPSGVLRVWGVLPPPALPGQAVTPPPVPDQHKRAEAQQVLREGAPYWWALACACAKTAAQVDEEAASQMTDTGLSMALAEEDQVDLVAEALPIVEQCLSYCSRLLVLARKGEVSIVPDTVRQTMQALDQLAEKLTALVESRPDQANESL